MRKQIDGQLNLFDYISEEEKRTASYVDHIKSEEHDKTEKSSETDPDDKNVITLYKNCAKCWCSTCSHNEKGRAVPRDFAGEKKPCPSCDFCVSQKKAEICEIGSYENGCKLRAEEEGITP